jgi:signal peptidase II
MDKKTMAAKAVPFTLMDFIIALDQATKGFIAAKWPQNTIVADIFDNGLLEIWHVRNKVIAFSLGENLPNGLKPIIFIALPILVLAFLVWYYWTSSEFNRLQRWAVAGIIGGGTGNLIDRILRPDGVVDFISVNIPNINIPRIFSMDRWPTFNVADASVVICTAIWLFSIIFSTGTWRVKSR